MDRSPFDENKVEQANKLDQAVSLIQRLQAEEELRQQSEHSERILQVNAEIASTAASAHNIVLEKIVQGARDVVNADCAVIYPYFADLAVYDVNNVRSIGLNKALNVKPKPRKDPEGMAATVMQYRSLRTIHRVGIVEGTIPSNGYPASSWSVKPSNLLWAWRWSSAANRLGIVC